jgi:hypothetical protein
VAGACPHRRRFEGKKWENNTLLHVAAKEGYARMVEYEVDPKSHSIFEITEVEINPLNKKKRTPLHMAFTPPQVVFPGCAPHERVQAR